MKNKGSFVKESGKSKAEDLQRFKALCQLKMEEQGLDREEEEIDKNLKEVKRKEMELKVHLMKLELDKAKVGDEAKRVNMDCSWYANEMKFLFCKGFVLEVVFKVEEEIIEKEEKNLLASQGPSLKNFDKILKSFEYLQKFEKEVAGKGRKKVGINVDCKGKGKAGNGFVIGFNGRRKEEDKKRSESEKNFLRAAGIGALNRLAGIREVSMKCLTPTRQILRALG